MALINKLSAIGDAIRAKTGGTEKLTLDQMPDAINSITSGSSEVINYTSAIYTGRVGATTSPTNVLFQNDKKMSMSNSNWQVLFGVLSYSKHYIYKLNCYGLQLMIDASSTPFDQHANYNLFDIDGTAVDAKISGNSITVNEGYISSIVVHDGGFSVSFKSGGVSKIFPPLLLFKEQV